MKSEKEIMEMMKELGIPAEQAWLMAREIDQAEGAWNRLSEPAVPAGLFKKTENAMGRALVKVKARYYWTVRIASAAACLALVLGAAMYQMNLAGQADPKNSVSKPVSQPQMVADDNVFYELKYWQENRQMFYQQPQPDANPAKPTKAFQPSQQQDPYEILLEDNVDESVNLVSLAPLV